MHPRPHTGVVQPTPTNATVEYGQELALVGAVDALGNWDIKQAVKMAWTDGDVWTAQAEVPAGCVRTRRSVAPRAGSEPSMRCSRGRHCLPSSARTPSEKHKKRARPPACAP
jgi:hypothetical protein